MSQTSTLQNENTSAVGSPAETNEGTARRHRLAALYDKYRTHTLTAPLKAAGFWSAVVLPFLYTPLLFDGFQGEEATVFVWLLVLNLVSLIVGHSYKRD